MIAQFVRTSRLAPAAAIALCVSILAGSGVRAEDGLKPSPREQEYPPGWAVATPPSPQIYEYNVGITDTDWHATGQLPVPQPTQSARVIYQMVPGGLRYHRVE